VADRQVVFGPLTVRYDEQVLAPRPWTVLQSRWAADLAPTVPEGPMLELCSGAGHIGQAAARWSGRRIVQVDIDAHACTLARANAVANELADLVEVRCGDLEEVVTAGERFPLVLADPPYLPTEDVDDWPDDPELAVDGGDDGLELARAALRVAAAHVTAGGVVLLQALGRAQVEQLADAIAEGDLVVDDVRDHDERRAVALLRPVGSGDGGPARRT
jgi:methylase of polypeptide subunit release factors